MTHHPNCPYSRQTQLCIFNCHLIPPLQPDYVLYPPSNPTHTYQPPPPPYYPNDATNPMRLIQHGFTRVSNHLDQITERHVHFEPSQRAKQRTSSICANGTYDITHERTRTTRQRLPLPVPDVTIQIRPRQQIGDQPVLKSIMRPVAKLIRGQPSVPLPLHDFRPVQPTMYIVTFAVDTVPIRSRNVAKLLDEQIPRRNPPIPHLYTIDARTFIPPSARICERYSGISPVVQDAVMQDPRARKAVNNAVAELLAFGVHQRGKVGGGEVSMAVCCHMGTHRSVAIGERIAQGVKAEVGRLGVEEGVRVVVRHVHRMRGRRDPF